MNTYLKGTNMNTYLKGTNMNTYLKLQVLLITTLLTTGCPLPLFEEPTPAVSEESTVVTAKMDKTAVVEEATTASAATPTKVVEEIIPTVEEIIPTVEEIIPTVEETPAEITGISRSVGVVGMTMLIFGKNFKADDEVKIGGVNCSTVVIADTQISCTLPSGVNGLKSVTVGTITATSSISYVSPASLSLNSSNYDFWRVEVGTTASTSFTLTNNGGYTSTGLTFSIADARISVVHDCAVIDAGASCTFQVNFAPLSEASHSAVLNLSYDNGNSLQPLAASLIGEAMVRKVSKIAAFSGSTCALYNLGNVKCWGDDTYGALGNNVLVDASTAQSIIGVSKAIDISGSYYSVCAVIAPNNELVCWGRTIDGHSMFGQGNAVAAPVSKGVSGVSELATGSGGNVQCYRSGTSVSCFGNNSHAQLGSYIGLVRDNIFYANPQTINIGFNAVAVAQGHGMVCALSDGGRVKCWGHIQDNHYVLQPNNSGFMSPILSNVTEISIGGGGGFACGRVSDGTVKCWGPGSENFGTATSDYIYTVTGISTATSISAGSGSACALLQDRSIKCWGFNDFGKLGNGNTTTSNSPVNVIGISTAIQIVTGHLYSCALLQDGTIKCWGANHSGQLGNNSTTNSSTPVVVQGL